MNSVELVGIVTPLMVQKLEKFWKYPNDVELRINSEGGITRRCDAILSIIHFLKEQHKMVKGLVLGDAHSAAFVILQACTVRHAVPTANFMFHAPGVLRLGRNGEPPFVDDRNPDHPMYQVFMRNLPARTGIPLTTLNEWSNEERYFSAEEALELNFIDRIIETAIEI